jgi:hypothetical protein
LRTVGSISFDNENFLAAPIVFGTDGWDWWSLFNTPNSLKYLEISILGFWGGFGRIGSINNIYFTSKKKIFFSYWIVVEMKEHYLFLH